MKLSRARVGVQVLVHLVIIGHLLAFYYLGWKRVGGADIQAFFHDFLGSGLISAGVILAVAAFLVTLVLGRVFCGWACHFGGLQDFSAWVLRKLGWRPHAPRTRILHFLPYVLLVFAFLLPEILRWQGGGGESFRLRLDFSVPPWANLPGFAVSVITLLACGTGILLFLGTRGFCRYVCPYGAVFRVLDPVAPMRVRRTGSCGGDSCSSGGHPAAPAPCTAACPMGVAVHEETQRRGAVHDVDCVRCHLCVEACPHEALSFGFRSVEAAAPGPGAAHASITAARPAERASEDHGGGISIPLPVLADPRPRFTYSLGQEILVAVVAVAAFLAWDLVYAAHFLAATMALGEGFLALFALELFRRRDFRVFGLALRRGGSWTFAGAAVPALVLLTILPIFHAGAFKALRFAGERATREAVGSGAVVFGPGRTALERAASFYERALLIMPGDRLTLHRYAAVLVDLGDRRAVAMAERLASNEPNDRDAQELLRVARARLGAAAPAGGVTSPANVLDKAPRSR